MKLSKGSAYQAGRTIPVGIIFFLAALLLPPWLPWMPKSGLDSSWMLVLNHAFTHRLQFGKEIIFTFGPYGFLYSNQFYPEHYRFQIFFWLVIAGVIAASAGFLLSKKGNTCISLLYQQVTLISGVVIILIFVGCEVILSTIYLLFVFVLLKAETRLHHFSTILLLALCAFIGLIKLTFAVLGFAMVLCADLYRISKGKYLPVYLAAYILFFASFFLLAHQQIGNLVAFIITSLEIAGGYSEAMQLFRPLGEIMAFIGLAFCLLVLIAYVEWRFGRWREGDWRGPILLLSIMIFNFIAFKAGFVRHDGHAMNAWGSLVGCIAISSTRFYHDVPVRTWRVAMTILFIVAAGISMRYDAGYHHRNPLDVASATLTRGLSKRIVAIKDLGLNNRFAHLSEEYRFALEKIRNAAPLPPIQGTVDLYPWDASLVLAHGLRYAPRPVFQSYSAYSKPLIEVNRAHLHSEQAPTTLLFNVQTIDGRFPAMEDGASWPDIWARYDPINVSGDYLVLARRTTARMAQTVPVLTVDIPFSKPLKVPHVSGLTWVTIDVEKTVLGTFMNLLFKLPIIELDLTMADGSTRIERIVPNVASRGFVMNPVIESNTDFARVALNNGVQLAPSDQAVAMTIEGPEYISWLYNNAIRVSFSQLAIDGPMERKPSLKLLAGLHAPRRSLRILAPPAAFEFHPAREGGYVDVVKATDSRVDVLGWVKLGDTEKAQAITIVSSIRPSSHFIKTVKRPDVASALRNEGLAQSGFRIILRFDGPASAQNAAKELCVYAQSETTPVALVHSNNQQCRQSMSRHRPSHPAGKAVDAPRLPPPARRGIQEIAADRIEGRSIITLP